MTEFYFFTIAISKHMCKIKLLTIYYLSKTNYSNADM